MPNNIKIVILGAGVGRALAAALVSFGKAANAAVVESPVYTLKALPFRPDTYPNIKEHGHYRQFEKRDKRKNFR